MDSPGRWTDLDQSPELGASPPLPVGPPAVPTPYSDVVFPPIATLPRGSSTTINFNFLYIYMPLHSITIEGAYTFKGNPVRSTSRSRSPIRSRPSAQTTAIIQLAGLQLQPGAVVSTASGTTLHLGTAATPTSLQLLLDGGITKSGGQSRHRHAMSPTQTQPRFCRSPLRSPAVRSR